MALFVMLDLALLQDAPLGAQLRQPLSTFTSGEPAREFLHLHSAVFFGFCFRLLKAGHLILFTQPSSCHFQLAVAEELHVQA
jgi:hypothetical protein